MPALSNNPVLVVGVVLAVVLVVVVMLVVGRQMYRPRRVQFADPVIQSEDGVAAPPPPLEPAGVSLDESVIEDEVDELVAAIQPKTFASIDTALGVVDIDARLESMKRYLGKQMDTEKAKTTARVEYGRRDTRRHHTKLTPRNHRHDRADREPTKNRDLAKRAGGTVSGTF